MNHSTPPERDRPLDQISTHWTLVTRPDEFTFRYLDALRSYLLALLRDPHDAEEVLQEFMVQVMQKGFTRTSPDRGRFRFYLKTAVRNCAITWLRRRRGPTVDVALLQDTLADSGPSPAQQWEAGWCRCLLERTWRELDRHERRSPGNHAWTVLKIVSEHPELTSDAQAELASAALGKPVKPEAFRKQLSRARRLFAELLLQEVYQSLEADDPAGAEEELTELGLLHFVDDFLPADWRTGGTRGTP